MIRLLHQLGHRYQWSLDSLIEEQTGDGIIIGPRYMQQSKVRELPEEIRKKAIFDPQFFLPQSAQAQLATYSFFPQVLAEEFSTSEWNDDLKKRCAEECLRFQYNCDFEYLMIPCRYYEGMPSDYIDNQKTQFVEPFIDARRRLDLQHPLLLQVIVTDQMLKDEQYRTSLLNWLTSYPELAGVYLIYSLQNRGKQIADVDFLLGLLHFCSALKEAGLYVIVGYTNTEALLLVCTGVDVVTMGSYENLRMFSTRAFEANIDNQPRGPNARVYIPRLLQWIEGHYRGAIEQTVGNIDDYLEDNQHRLQMFSPTYNWHFTKPEPYKHFFQTFSKQLRRICSAHNSSRITVVRNECQQALEEYENLESSGVVFDENSSGRHISSWLTALNVWGNNA